MLLVIHKLDNIYSKTPTYGYTYYYIWKVYSKSKIASKSYHNQGLEKVTVECSEI